MLRDAAVFDDDHLPREIVGRNSQMNEVTDALAPIEDGFRAENCFLFGPSGAGKTTVARAAVRELRREVLEVPTAYLNCWQDYTRVSILARALEELTGAVMPKNATASQALTRLQETLNSPSVIILDEVDQIQDTKVLYDLHTVRGLAWICVANREEDLLARLDERVQSRLSVGYRVQFDRYNVETVTEILDRRATQGSSPVPCSARPWRRWPSSSTAMLGARSRRFASPRRRPTRRACRISRTGWSRTPSTTPRRWCGRRHLEAQHAPARPL